MAQDMAIDLRREAEEFRKWIQQKVSLASKAMAAKKTSKSIGAIVAMYCYVQDGWVALDLNTDKEFQFEGDVSKAAWRDLLKRPSWQEFAEAEGKGTMTFVEANGKKSSMTADKMTDEFLSEHFGQMIADVLAAAWKEGDFAPLALRPGCIFSVNDFYGNWGWEAEEVSGKLKPREFSDD